MKTSLFSCPGISKKNLWKSLAILLFGLVLTALAIELSVNKAESDANKEFVSQCNEIKSVLLVRLHAHAEFLRSGAGLFDASDSVTRKEWANFYEHSNINKNLPGVQGIGYSKIIRKSELQHHIESIREEGFPTYSVKPKGDRAIYSAIIYLEPFRERNLRAFGYDMLTEPVRCKAMETSRDSNLAVLTGKVKLVQETQEDVQAGTLMYVPVYRHDMPITTVEQRRAAIKGWVYSPYRMNDMMEGMLGIWDSTQQKRIRLKVYDNDTLSSNTLLYDSKRNDTLANTPPVSCKNVFPIDFNGKRWILKFTQSEPQSLCLQGESLTIAISGLAISLLLFSISFSLFNTRQRALQIADKLTRDLKESELKFSTAFHSSPQAINITCLDDGLILEVNKSFEQILGFTKEEVIGRSTLELGIWLSPDQRKYVTDILRKEGHILNHELRIKTKTGTILNVLASIELIDFSGKTCMLSTYFDITERKRAEEKLIEKEVSLRYAQQIAKMGSWKLELQTQHIKWSENTFDFYGFDPSKVEPSLELFKSTIFPEDLHYFNEMFAKIITEKEPLSFELRVIVKNNAIKCIQNEVVPIIKDGILTYITGAFIDITKRKQTEETISMLAHAIRSISECVSITDTEDKILFVNKAFLQTYQYEEHELIGQPITIIRSPNNPTDIINPILPSTLKGGWTGELLNLKKDGTEFLAFVSTSVILNDMGNPVALIGIARDITEDKKAQEKLLFIQKAIDSATIAIGISDAQGRHFYQNKASSDMFEYATAEELAAAGSGTSVIVDAEVAKQMFASIMAGNSWSGELDMKTKSGRIFPAYEFADSIKDNEGNIVGLIGIVTDISERKQAEKDILEMNQELSKYLQVISHDLRSPLVGVQGYAQRYGTQTETLKTILANCHFEAADKEQIDRITFEDMPKSLNAILASVDKMDRLLNALLKISRSGRDSLLIKEVNMNQLFSAIVATLNFHKEEHAAQINIADLPDCYGDEHQLNQLFTNIMGNAIKYYDPSRQLIIEVSGYEHHNKIVYGIKDTGIGIPAAKLEKIWEVFYRVNPTSPLAGEGIGLSFVKRIADKHKGKIWATSTEGVGSTFFVELQRNEFTE